MTQVREPAVVAGPSAAASILAFSDPGPTLLPLDAGEQYRFTFAMDACIGCHSCEVACAEQNDLPVGVAWRRVGEIEGGEYPHTRRFSLSMACNHCLEPSCLIGCPTDAYVKLSNGVVHHRAEECIGCGYCTWNCPYEVPVMDPVRKIATKCDMCLPRLESGDLPACVLACPTHAIGVEAVDINAWRADHRLADGPNLPPSDLTISTTRIEAPTSLPFETFAADDHRVEPAAPHWPLVLLTLLTQLAVGTVASTLLVELLAGRGGGRAVSAGAVAAFLAGALALVVSVTHLGHPLHAYKALRAWRRSWLSREVALFGAFAMVAMAYASSWSLFPAGWPDRLIPVLGALAVAVGVGGIYASARIYLVPARPAWNSARTVVSFFLTGAAAGPLLALLTFDRSGLAPGPTRLLLVLAATAVLGELVVLLVHVAALARRPDPEHRGALELLVIRFRILLNLRVGAVVIALAALAWAFGGAGGPQPATGPVAVALVVVALGELAARYLFYVTVVSTGIPGRFPAHRVRA